MWDYYRDFRVTCPICAGHPPNGSCHACAGKCHVPVERAAVWVAYVWPIEDCPCETCAMLREAGIIPVPKMPKAAKGTFRAYFEKQERMPV